MGCSTIQCCMNRTFLDGMPASIRMMVVNRCVHWQALKFSRSVAEQLLCCRIRIVDVAFRIATDDAIRCGFQNDLQTMLGSSQLGGTCIDQVLKMLLMDNQPILRLMEFGHVVHHHDCW